MHHQKTQCTEFDMRVCIVHFTATHKRKTVSSKLMYLQISLDLIVVYRESGPPKKCPWNVFDLIVPCLAALYGTLLKMHFGHFYTWIKVKCIVFLIRTLDIQRLTMRSRYICNKNGMQLTNLSTVCGILRYHSFLIELFIFITLFCC